MDGQDSPLRAQTFFFICAGREFYALAWVMAGASRAIAQTLQQIPDTSTAAVVIPDVPGLPLSRMYEVSVPVYVLRTNAWMVDRFGREFQVCRVKAAPLPLQRGLTCSTAR